MRLAVQMMTLVFMLIVGIVLGIDSAEKNMQEMQGIQGAPRAIQITPQNGRIEIAVLGQVMETPNPVREVAPQHLAKVEEKVKESSTILATIGNGMGSGLREAARKVVEFFFGPEKGAPSGTR
jgi:hypothetical protein